jgi:hypothetical protein
MIRLFKHYIPHSVILLGLIDLVLLMISADFAWRCGRTNWACRRKVLKRGFNH